MAAYVANPALVDRFINFLTHRTAVDAEEIGAFGQEVGPQVGPIAKEVMEGLHFA